MKPGSKIIFCAAMAAMSLLSVARATTLTFEDRDPSPASFDAMRSPYSGFTFTGWYFGQDTVYSASSGSIDLFTDYTDPQNPLDYVVTNNNAKPVTIN